MDTNITSRTLRLPATIRATRSVRNALDDVFGDLDEDRLVVVKVLASELVTNAVRHPARDGNGGELEIVLVMEHTGAGVRVEVRDHDPRPLPPAGSPQVHSDSGMGLYIVEQLATSWGHRLLPRSEGKAVWFELATSDWF